MGICKYTDELMNRQKWVREVVQLAFRSFIKPNLNAIKGDECHPKHNKKRYEMAALPSIGSAAQLNTVSYSTDARLCVW